MTAFLSAAVITVVMACAVAGAVASLFQDDEGLGKEFLEGLHAIGAIFIPVAGIMASLPFLAAITMAVFGPICVVLGADPAMATTSLIAVDMGGYQLAERVAQSPGSWMMAMFTGYMAGATIVFTIPVGLALLDRRDHPYFALGILSGILSVPVGVLVSSLLVMAFQIPVRATVSTDAASDTVLELTLPMILHNLMPLVLFVLLIAGGLHFAPRQMVRGFIVFGRVLYGAIKLVLVACIVEYFTAIFYGKGLFTMLFGGWGFDPIIADEANSVRALEVAGYIGIMLAGAFPMVYLMTRYLSRPMQALGKLVGLESAGAAGILATMANVLAMFRLVSAMRPKDKVLNVAFAVCASFMFGDHLAFTANFQPNLILPVLLGKLCGGMFGFGLAYFLSVPRALELERLESLQPI